jgi:hypothetical protein
VDTIVFVAMAWREAIVMLMMHRRRRAWSWRRVPIDDVAEILRDRGLFREVAKIRHGCGERCRWGCVKFEVLSRVRRCMYVLVSSLSI